MAQKLFRYVGTGLLEFAAGVGRLAVAIYYVILDGLSDGSITMSQHRLDLFMALYHDAVERELV